MVGYSGATFQQSSNFDAGRAGLSIDLIVMHGTFGAVGGDSGPWLRGAAGGTSNTDSSAHYLIARSGKVYQFVDERDTAWHAGNLPYNRRSIGIEHERAASELLTPEQIGASAALLRDVANRNGIRISRQTVIGHSEVPDPYHAGEFGGSSHHTGCPGADYPWDQILGFATQLDPAPRYFRETGHYVAHGFLAKWLSDPRALADWGYPISEEFTNSAGVVVQWFERARFEWHPGCGQPWDVLLGLVGSEDAGGDRQRFPEAFAPKEAAAA